MVICLLVSCGCLPNGCPGSSDGATWIGVLSKQLSRVRSSSVAYCGLDHHYREWRALRALRPSALRDLKLIAPRDPQLTEVEYGLQLSAVGWGCG